MREKLNHDPKKPRKRLIRANFCEDLGIERMAHGRVFDFRFVELYANTIGRSCKNVTMEDVTCLAPVNFRCRILGLDQDHIMEDITMTLIKCGIFT